MKKRLVLPLLTALLLALLCGAVAAADAAEGGSEVYDGQLRLENGMMQPMLQWSDLRAADYTNDSSDILRFCVYVETDHDTDQDGMADLVKVLVQLPRAAAE